MYRFILVLWLCLSLAACVAQPDVYAPPEQRKPLEPEILTRFEPMVEMSDPAAEQFFVQDITTGHSETPWRWTGRRPTVRVDLNHTANYRYRVVFAIAEATFKDTGPVRITFYVNNQKLDSVKYDTPGERIFEKPVPETMLKASAGNTLAAEIDKVWVSPDKSTLGFILTRMGLVQ